MYLVPISISFTCETSNFFKLNFQQKTKKLSKFYQLEKSLRGLAKFIQFACKKKLLIGMLLENNWSEISNLVMNYFFKLFGVMNVLLVAC